MASPIVSLFEFTIIPLFVIFFTGISELQGCRDEEAQALLLMKSNFNDSDGELQSWVKGTNCCLWKDVYCDPATNHVVRLDVVTVTASPPSHLDGMTDMRVSLPDGMAEAHVGRVISDSVCQLSALTTLNLNSWGFTGTIPLCLGKLSYLQTLDLSRNSLSGQIPPALCLLTKLTNLYLGKNQLNGIIPNCFNYLSSLSGLFLGVNHLSGGIPHSLGNIYSLVVLDVSHNTLSGQIPQSLGNLSSLQYLDVSFNRLNGTLPHSIAKLPSLYFLDAYGNAFNESIQFSSLPSSLTHLSLSLNHEIISVTLFYNLQKLDYLLLSNCVVNISTTWVPPFQLYELHLRFCNIDGQIPHWISTQFRLFSLELTNCNLYGEIPSWVWSSSNNYLVLNFSGNHLQGSLFGVNASLPPFVDLSYNELSGPIPSFWNSFMSGLYLNNNNFSGNIPSILGRCYLKVLNLESNQLNGTIPPSLSNCRGEWTGFQALNVGNNNLEGSIPQEFGNLGDIYSLVFRDNKLSGLFPSSLTNCLNLHVLDIGNNMFEGQIPKSIANFSDLRVLVMKGNHFSGGIPPEIGQLKQLQILDLSSNHLSGNIPHSIISLEAMAVPREDGYVLDASRDLWFKDDSVSYRDAMTIVVKGIHLKYPYILSTFTFIDLSSNQLSGDVSTDLGNLKGLRFLNLSRNSLSGTIPNSVAEMGQLESLDLSMNNFSGKIPEGIRSLNYLGFFSVSNNNLWGPIPQGEHMMTFQESSFSGNPNLWGCPLRKNCSLPKFRTPPPARDEEKNEKEDRVEIPWYEIGVGASYVVSCTVVLALLLSNTEWGRAYFEVIDIPLKAMFPSFRDRRV